MRTSLPVQFLLIIASLISVSAHSAIQIPKNLSTRDQIEVVRTLGPGTAARAMSSPYALGGYMGLEVAAIVDSIDTSGFSSLGDKLASGQAVSSVPKLSVAKGLYNNVDLFLQFSPYNKSTEVSQFGGLLRWGFFEAALIPVTSSLQVHLNNANFSNLVSTQTSGVDWVTGIQVEDVSLYAGVGMIQVSGRFVGGAEGVTATQAEQVQDLSHLRIQAGANLKYEWLTFGLQLDRVYSSHLSFKFGFEF